MQGLKSCVFSVLVFYHLIEKSQMQNSVVLFSNDCNTKTYRYNVLSLIHLVFLVTCTNPVIKLSRAFYSYKCNLIVG